ncbi:MAG: hypothetical protein WD077_01305 [Bacteroidia bacterium]
MKKNPLDKSRFMRRNQVFFHMIIYFFSYVSLFVYPVGYQLIALILTLDMLYMIVQGNVKTIRKLATFILMAELIVSLYLIIAKLFPALEIRYVHGIAAIISVTFIAAYFIIFPFVFLSLYRTIKRGNL